MNQNAFLRAQVGPENEALFSTCPSVYPCGTPLASPKGSEFMVKGDMAKARQLLKQSGYDGKPIVLMRPTDLQSIHKLPLVANQLLKQAGFNVELVTMDWGTLVARRAKKDPADQGGWNIFLTAWVGADIMNPLTSAPLGGQGEKGWAGWASDAELEKLRDQYARARNGCRQKANRGSCSSSRDAGGHPCNSWRIQKPRSSAQEHLRCRKSCRECVLEY